VRYRVDTRFLEAESRCDRRIPERADTLYVAGVPLRVLSSADDLLRICVRALRRPTASVVWVADVLALLEKASEVVDWDVFVEECRARRYATRP